MLKEPEQMNLKSRQSLTNWTSYYFQLSPLLPTGTRSTLRRTGGKHRIFDCDEVNRAFDDHRIWRLYYNVKSS